MRELLLFKPHPAPFLAERGAVQAIIKCENGHTASIVRGVSMHHPDRYEVWRSCDPSPRIVGSEAEVHQLLIELEQLSPDSEKIGWTVD